MLKTLGKKRGYTEDPNQVSELDQMAPKGEFDFKRLTEEEFERLEGYFGRMFAHVPEAKPDLTGEGRKVPYDSPWQATDAAGTPVGGYGPLPEVYYPPQEPLRGKAQPAPAGNAAVVPALTPEQQAAVDQKHETMTDDAEKGAFEALAKAKKWAILFVLQTIGKSRGYTEQLDPSQPRPTPQASEEDDGLVAADGRRAGRIRTAVGEGLRQAGRG